MGGCIIGAEPRRARTCQGCCGSTARTITSDRGAELRSGLSPSGMPEALRPVRSRPLACRDRMSFRLSIEAQHSRFDGRCRYDRVTGVICAVTDMRANHSKAAATWPCRQTHCARDPRSPAATPGRKENIELENQELRRLPSRILAAASLSPGGAVGFLARASKNL